MSSQHDTANRILYADPVDPYEMLNTPWGHIPAWKAATIATGSMGVYETVRNDAVAAQAKLDDLAVREQAVTARERTADARDRAFKDAVAKFMDRAAPIVDRMEQARADQQREPEEPLANSPGAPGDPNKPPQPADDIHAPTGDLHAVPAKEDPEQDIEQDSRGEFLRLHNDQTEFPTGEQPIFPPRPQVAAGLDQTT